MKKNNQSKFELLIQDIFDTCPLDEEDEKRILNIEKAHKEEISEKDKLINVYIDITKNSDKVKTERNELEYQLQQLKYQLQEKDKEIVKLKEEQLYKEDFKKMITTSYSSKGHTNIESW